MCKLVQLVNGVAVADIKGSCIENIILQANNCLFINKIVLFGSALETRCTEDSDIDIAVFGNKTKNSALNSKSYCDFQSSLFEYNTLQDYDILYFKSGDNCNNSVMQEEISLVNTIYERGDL